MSPWVVLLHFILGLQGTALVKDLESVLLQVLTVRPFHLNNLNIPLQPNRMNLQNHLILPTSWDHRNSNFQTLVGRWINMASCRPGLLLYLLPLLLGAVW